MSFLKEVEEGKLYSFADLRKLLRKYKKENIWGTTKSTALYLEKKGFRRVRRPIKSQMVTRWIKGEE